MHLGLYKNNLLEVLKVLMFVRRVWRRGSAPPLRITTLCVYVHVYYERRRTAAAADGVGLYTYFQPFDNNSTIGKCGGKSKGKRSIAVRNTPHRYGNGNSHAIWDHTVIPANRQM